MGDMSDNYPGVSGIGPKTATELLDKYSSLDSIYSHLDEIKSSIKEKLTNDKSNAYLSQKLAKLIDNIPLKFRLKSSRLNEDIYSGLQILFTDYGFKSLASRLAKKILKSLWLQYNQIKPHCFNMTKNLKIALVHDYLKEYGGAERVLLALSDMYPDAPIYTAFYKKGSSAYKHFKHRRLIPSWVHYIPF